MEADAGQARFDDPQAPFLADGVGIVRVAVCLGDDKRGTVNADP
jgi:hypothetical protein